MPSLSRWFGAKPQSTFPGGLYYRSVDLDAVLGRIMGQPVEELWRTQPHLRTVVGFIARNVAQIGLQAFTRDDDGGRTRLRDGRLADLLRSPNPQTTQFDLLYSTMSSLCLYDIAFWWVGVDPATSSGWIVRHIPTAWVLNSVGQSAFAADYYRIATPRTLPGWVDIPASDLLVFHGWDPFDPQSGTSPVHALKAVLAEQVAAQAFREQMWRNGGRVGSYITRPVEAPEWTEGGEGSPRARFIASWRAKYSGNDGADAGGTPLLEDGMELKSIAFNPRESQYVEAAKLSLETVAQVFHVNPTMVGVMDNANYSNVREFRKMLYGDTLGPELERVQQQMNMQLVPRVSSRRNVYVEFNLQSKLQGSFEEQSTMLQASIGAPYMTINEGRARLNMPAVSGGDELVKPLNVTQPGHHSPIPAAPGSSDDPDGDDDEAEDDESAAAKSGQISDILSRRLFLPEHELIKAVGCNGSESEGT